MLDKTVTAIEPFVVAVAVLYFDKAIDFDTDSDSDTDPDGVAARHDPLARALSSLP